MSHIYYSLLLPAFCLVILLSFSLTAQSQEVSRDMEVNIQIQSSLEQSDRTGIHSRQPVPQDDPIDEFDEEFFDIDDLPDLGWALQNNSDPVGTSGWFQGNPAVFPSVDDGDDYIGANFNNTAGVGTISNWLMTPEVNLANNTELNFWTRTVAGSAFPDRLEVRMSTEGSSTDVGETATSVGDFTILLLSINEGLTQGGYPEAWENYSLIVDGLDAPTSGRFAFRYYVTDGGPAGVNSNYIGIDKVSVSQPPTSVDGGETGLPREINLAQNYPNPFNPSTVIDFALPSDSHVVLTVYDMLGREVAKLVDREMHAGTHSVAFDASSLTSGVYFYRLQAGDEVRTNKMMLMK